MKHGLNTDQNMTRSPFPGMDPYLERPWVDVQLGFVCEARRVLNHLMPVGLAARVDERQAVESPEDMYKDRGRRVWVYSPSTADPAEGAGGPAVIEAPYKLVVEMDPIIGRFLRVEDEKGELVTVIEFISPANKRGPGLKAFRDRRVELLAAGVHVVEIDLVRPGDWRALMRPEACPEEAVSLYRALVRTARRKRGSYLFPMGIREPLCDVPVPLRPKDTPVRLPVQGLLDAVYAASRFDRTIDYGSPLEPPLEGEDARFVEEVLKGRAAG